eukprot:m.109152 g.109152  ORF g.109152 m.109152 type:complete len:449 (-) comp27933_c0_seq1:263-1609(-)
MSFVRDLSAVEATFALPWHRPEEKVVPNNIVLGFFLSHAPNQLRAEAQQVVNIIQQRHPMLRCGIRRNTPSKCPNDSLGRLAFFKTDKPIEIMFRECVSLHVDSPIIQDTHVELLNFTDFGAGPLARFVILESQRLPHSVVFIHACHAGLDGRSCEIIAKEFVSLLVDIRTKLPSVVETHELKSLKEMMVEENVLPCDGYEEHTNLVMSKRPNDAGIKGELGDPDKQLGYGSLMLLLSSENTTKLINLAKSHGVKPNTIVSVAWANTVAQYTEFHIPNGSSMFVVNVHDARNAFGRDYASTLSTWMGPGFVSIPTDVPVQAQYALLQKQVETNATNQWYFNPATREMHAEWDAPTRWATAPMHVLSYYFRKESAAYSNLGKIVFRSSDTINVERVWLVGGVFPDSNLILQNAVTNDVSTLSIQYLRPAHSSENIQLMATSFLDRMGIC